MSRCGAWPSRQAVGTSETMIKLKRGTWQQSLTVEEPDDYGKVMLTKTEDAKLTRFIRTFCPYKRGRFDPQRKVKHD